MSVLRLVPLGALAGYVLVSGCERADAGFQPDGSRVVDPGGAVWDCVPSQLSTLAPSDPTAFGASSLAMLDAVLPAGATIPLFWVGYDDLDAPVSYSPGASETQLRLSFTPRAESLVHQSFTPPTDAPCEPSRVDVPVHVTLETLDGALMEAFDTDVSFAQRDVARLHVELAPDTLRGSLAFAPSGALAAGWQLRTLRVDVSLWPGGTSGSIAPAFVKPALTPETAVPPLRTGPEQMERSREGLGEGPGVPLHWTSLAVWPRRERCTEGAAIAAAERPFGWSPRDALAALAETATFSLVTDSGATPVRATFEEPPGLICAGTDVGDGSPSIIVPGRITATGRVATGDADAAPGGPLDPLTLSGHFLVSASSALDGSGITGMRWQRWMPDVTSLAESREAFAASTGLALDAPDHYQLFWWTTAAEQYRTTTDSPWLSSGEVVVYGADGFSEFSVGTGAFEGQTAAEPITLRTLEGDVLVYGTVTP